MAMTYSELVTAVQDICENTFATVDMNMFIQQAEQRIYNTVQVPVARKRVAITALGGDPIIYPPTDFLSVVSLAHIGSGGAYSFLLNKDQTFIREAYPYPIDGGIPKHYAIMDPDDVPGPNFGLVRFFLGPNPSDVMSMELVYFAYPESIVTATTTWLGDHFDSALLNGTLVEAIRFMKGEPDMVKLYQDMYLQSIALLKNLTDGKERSDAYRSGQPRVQVS
jgi:hypothetical protein